MRVEQRRQEARRVALLKLLGAVDDMRPTIRQQRRGDTSRPNAVGSAALEAAKPRTGMPTRAASGPTSPPGSAAPPRAAQSRPEPTCTPRAGAGAELGHCQGCALPCAAVRCGSAATPPLKSFDRSSSGWRLTAASIAYARGATGRMHRATGHNRATGGLQAAGLTAASIASTRHQPRDQ